MERLVTPGQLGRKIAADLKAMQRRVKGAVRKTAKQAVKVCKANVPAEYSEIAPGIEALEEGGAIIVRSHAPHSDAVEVGVSAFSTSGLPDPADLAAWIRRFGSARTKLGAKIRRQLRWFKNPRKRGQGASLPADAPLRLAYATIGHIRKHGAPRRFMKSALPDIEKALGSNIEDALSSVGKAEIAALAAKSGLVASSIGAAAARLARTSGKKAKAPRAPRKPRKG